MTTVKQFVASLPDEQRRALGVGLCVGLVCGLFCGVVTGCSYGSSWARKSMQNDAASKGAGYYSVDAKTGNVWFQWQTYPPRTVIMRNGRLEDGP